jgi:hypothetical protein
MAWRLVKYGCAIGYQMMRRETLAGLSLGAIRGNIGFLGAIRRNARRLCLAS